MSLVAIIKTTMVTILKNAFINLNKSIQNWDIWFSMKPNISHSKNIIKISRGLNILLLTI